MLLFSCVITKENFIFLAVSGNGTLNKQAGIDYKQLSLLAKINENQSGEVSGTLLLLLQGRQLLSICTCL